MPDDGDPEPIVATLLRMGYELLDGYLLGGVDAWYTNGLPTGQIECLTVEDARIRSQEEERVWVLDVRGAQELETDGRIPHATNIPIRHILEHLDEIPRDKNILIFCGSGKRSMVAASLLRSRGWRDLSVVLGGIRAWKRARSSPRSSSLS